MKRTLGLALVAVACSVASERTTHEAPSSEHFLRVSLMLGARCGSLDCHGSAGRNLRLYGKFGLRLSKDDITGGLQTKPDEHAANYASVLALEPEILEGVFRNGGRYADQLTLMRKATNAENHKGGHALDENGKRCFISWIEGEVDEKACYQSSVLKQPPGFLDTGIGGSSGVGGTGGSTAGSGGASTGGSGELGGVAGAAGTTGWGGTSTGGSGATGGGGGGTGGEGGVICYSGDFWPCTYDAACLPIKPSPADHDAYAAEDCLDCHGPTGPGQEFRFGGVVWQLGAGIGAEHIEVGLRDPANFFYTCTDARGFFYVPAAGTPTVNWQIVENRIRAELGEKIMPGDKEHSANCNKSDCHARLDHQLWAP